MIRFEIDEISVHEVAAGVTGGGFSFSRYGDTELGCMIGARVGNVDGQPVGPRAASDLWNTLAPPYGYRYGMQPLSLRLDIVPESIREAVDWVNADVLHHASIRGQLLPLVQALQSRKVLLIGPEHLAANLKWLRSGGHVIVPTKDAYAAKERVLDEAHRAAFKVDAIVCCASMLSNTVIHALYPDFGNRVSMIDCGSLWDPYCGHKSRRYHRQLTPEIVKANLG